LREPAVTAAAKRTQLLRGVCDRATKWAYRRSGDCLNSRTQYEQCRHARHRRPAGVEEHITGKGSASETGRSHVWPSPEGRGRSASGRRGAVADDARAREVGRGHSSGEAGEQGGAIRCGVGGAKGRGQGEWVPALTYRAQNRMKRGRSLAHIRQACMPWIPEVEAVCGKAARTDLCGGRGVIPVPTATQDSW
jgi:hypothetical protein